MKKIITAVLVCSIILLSLCSFAPVKSVETENPIVTVDEAKVLEARFLNMLNHNFVYGEAFHNDEAFVNDSALALLSLVNDGFIDEVYLKDYIFNMYGKIYDDFSEYNPDAPKQEGLFYIIPRGYDLYEHKIASVIDNEDGSYTVVSEVVIDYHFGEKVNAFSTTFFIENEESPFGFNILYSDLAYPLEFAMAL
ncbi:MAG: hypothetical protein J6A78_03210 [Clostridia bacterium]|nr:hypothetical protein [Oscillospiraceae bacterium]MBO5358308.1 hypothetical protein [Clostridia bacterium]